MGAKLAFTMLGFSMGLISAVVAVPLLAGTAMPEAPTAEAWADMAPRCPYALAVSVEGACPYLQAIRQQRLSAGRCPATGAGGEGYRAGHWAPLPSPPLVVPDLVPLES